MRQIQAVTRTRRPLLGSVSTTCGLSQWIVSHSGERDLKIFFMIQKISVLTINPIIKLTSANSSILHFKIRF
jgi:hypothetical protein